MESTIKILEMKEGCSVIFSNDLKYSKNEQIYFINSSPELITVYSSRDDMQLRVQTYPYLGPMHQIVWKVPDTQNFIISLNIYKCLQEEN